ncbi:MAG TPA: hypothetical protein VEA41_09835, partial [Salinarimonas sp.]|nr:hypothetical protein [Salinarimonas sp.]
GRSANLLPALRRAARPADPGRSITARADRNNGFPAPSGRGGHHEVDRRLTPSRSEPRRPRELALIATIEPAIEEDVMAGKANFTRDEWARIVASPMVASMAITAADPSGLWGLLKESMSGGWALLEVKQDAGANPLAKAVADDLTNAEIRTTARESMQARFKGAQLSDLKGRAIDELRAVASLLDGKAAEEAAGFKRWLQTVAQRAAEAGNEGGFLGFGGVAVSDAERATLVEIMTALGESHPSPPRSS